MKSNGSLVQPVQLLSSSNLGNKKRPASPGLDEMLSTPPAKKKTDVQVMLLGFTCLPVDKKPHTQHTHMYIYNFRVVIPPTTM